MDKWTFLDEIGIKEKQISRLISLLNQSADEKFPEVRKKKSLLKNQNNYPYLFVANIMEPITINMIALNVYVMAIMFS